MNFYETNPPWKMPDEEKLDHKYYVKLRILFWQVNSNPYVLFADLSEYYWWAVENDIEMEHNLCILRGVDQKSTVMFVFRYKEDALAFKLSWV